MTLLPKPTLLAEEFYNKLGQDTSNIGVKNEFLEACAGCDCETKADEDSGRGSRSVEKAYEEFTWRLQHTGDAIVLPDGEVLGRVTNLRSAATYLAKALNQSTNDVIQMFLWLNSLSSPVPTPSQLDVAEDWLTSLKNSIDPNTDQPYVICRPPLCWLFRSGEGNCDANDDMEQDLSCLPCRLGLPDILNDEKVYELGLDYLCLTVKSEDLENVRFSNFCHSGYLGVRDIWQPGGVTTPIPYGPQRCVDKGGLPEVICDPVCYRNLPGPIRVVRT
uniref:hypothetical protein n=1 Tax=Pararhizobium sp. IMCC3301 TaxID=3067904 RepID=UPI002740E914|nr:hypothetical protein [Pararhizobium sp. IMCC3301]